MKNYFLPGKTGLIFIAIFILLIPSVIADDEISLSANLDKTDIPFEETVTLTLDIKWRGDITNYLFQVFPLPETENLRVQGTTSAVSSGEENGHEITRRKFEYTFKPIGSGIGTIESILLNYITMPDSIPGELSTQQFKILIAEPIPQPEESNLSRYLLWLIIIVVIGGAVTLFLIKRRKPVAEPKKTPEETLLDNLSIIRTESSSNRNLFFTKLYNVLVRYIELKYNLEVSGKSAQLVFEVMDKSSISESEKEKITSWLSMAEKEKFAPSSGEPGDIIRLVTELENYFK